MFSCSDVRTVVIGASPLDPYPSFYTNKQGEIAFDPSSNNPVFAERPVDSNETFIDRLKTAYRILQSETGRMS